MSIFNQIKLFIANINILYTIIQCTTFKLISFVKLHRKTTTLVLIKPTYYLYIKLDIKQRFKILLSVNLY